MYSMQHTADIAISSKSKDKDKTTIIADEDDEPKGFKRVLYDWKWILF